MMKKFLLTTTFAIPFALTACGGSDDAMIAAMNEEIAKPICQQAPLRGTRLRESEWGPIVEAMKEGGYVEEAPQNYDFSMWIQQFVEPRFAFTDKGRALITDGQFGSKEICFGERKVTEIIDSSDPFEERGREFVDVEARYEDKVTADWADDVDALKDRFTKEGTVKFRFVEHKEKGWVVDRQL